MQFNFTYGTGVTLDQIKGFEMAGKIWSTYLKDSATINIAIDLQKDFPGNAIAGAVPRINIQGYSPYRDNLKKDATSANDQLISQSNNIMSGGSFSGRFDLYDESGKNQGVTQTSPQLNVSSANAKALGLALPGGSNILDGYIAMRDLTGVGVSWDYDFGRTGSAPSGTLDFLSVAIHEIGHILGFQSSVDRPGWLDPKTNGDTKKNEEYTKSIKDRANAATPLDLFRYSDKSTLNADKKGVKPIDLAIGGNPYLSIKNGASPVAYFDTGSVILLGGSGLQASHFSSGGIMNAVLNQGRRAVVSAADLTALDAIGYDLASQGANTPVNYSQLLQQVTQGLAQRLGKTSEWLNANPTAIASLTRDVSEAASEMLDNSSVYKKKDLNVWSNGARGNDWWQGFKQTFMAEGVFESLGNDHDLEDHDHEDHVDGADEIIDLFTGFNKDQIFLNEDELDDLANSNSLYHEMIINQFASDLGIGDLAQTGFGSNVFVPQYSGGLADSNQLISSTSGGNPLYDLAVIV
jgi:hypothetical protein